MNAAGKPTGRLETEPAPAGESRDEPVTCRRCRAVMTYDPARCCEDCRKEIGGES